MCGVIFAVSAKIIAESVVSVLNSKRDLLAQIVMIAAAAMDYSAEKTEICHIFYHKLAATEAAVLKEHKGHARAFLCSDKLPAILNRVSAADLKRNSLTRPHRVKSYRDMAFPRGHYHYNVDVFVGNSGLVIGIYRRAHAAAFLNRLSASLCSVLVYVAYRAYRIYLLKHEPEKRSTSLAIAYVSHVYVFHKLPP